MSKETAPQSPEQRPGGQHEAVGNTLGERLKEDRERAAEKKGEIDNERAAEQARAEARELAISGEERSTAEQANDTPAPVHQGAPSKVALEESFNDTMKQVRSEMRAPSRAFSKVIHAKPVEKASEVAGATVARPNALLAGGIGAFVLTLAVYIIARHFGYPLSGFESIGAFILGWIVGMLIDYVRVLATGGRAR